MTSYQFAVASTYSITPLHLPSKNQEGNLWHSPAGTATAARLHEDVCSLNSCIQSYWEQEKRGCLVIQYSTSTMHTGVSRQTVTVDCNIC